MQDKITQIFKYVSIFTTDPDKDWRRLFVGLVCVLLGISAWSFFFYNQINRDIQISETKSPKNAGSVISEQGEELHRLVVELETKKSKNEAIVKGEYATVTSKMIDPSR